MVTKAKQRGKAKRKIAAEQSRKFKKPVKTRRPKRAVKKAAKEKVSKGALFAVIRLRGPVGIRKGIRDTLVMLRLDRVNHCVLVPANPSYKGMLHKAEECVTWGEINDKTLEKLIFKRGKIAGEDVEKAKAAGLSKKILSDNKAIKEAEMKPVFRLSPPSKGHKSVRKFYPRGDLGYRGEKINELLKRMI
jgi:large subunit ribosomal protein L30